MKKTLIFAAMAAFGCGLNAQANLTGTYTISGDANNQAVDNGNGSYELTSTSSTYSWVDFILTQPVTFSQLTDLDAVFTDHTGGADVGAPRLDLFLSNGHHVSVYLGSAPDYNDGVASLNTYSGVNLIGNNDAGRYDTSFDHLPGGIPGTTYSDALAQAGLGSLFVTDIQLTLDGGYGANGPEDLTLDSIDAAVPEPTTTVAGALLLLPLGVSAVRILRKRQTA